MRRIFVGVGVGIGVGIDCSFDPDSDTDPDADWVAGVSPPWDRQELANPSHVS